MLKAKKIYYCQNCGSQHTQWMGQCTHCKQWNTIVEELVVKQTNSPSATPPDTNANQSINFTDIDIASESRLSTYDSELDTVLGGGIVHGSVLLVGGEPGIGKSTLMLQMVLNLPQVKSLYISGEESAHQIKTRANRIGIHNEHAFLLTETQTHKILAQIKKIQPALVIIDSIQTLHSPYIESSAGSVSQIRACANELIELAKRSNIPIFLIGHITKDGHIAGPKILEHMVDVVLQFEGDRNHMYRILRAHKNRFGSSAEIGIYEMQNHGLQQVTNTSELFISKKDQDLSGSAIISSMEGARPIMVEVQALVSSAVYGTPQRSATGFDIKRLNMLLAVLEKRAGFRLAAKDVFLNVTGGIKLDDPSTDLGIIAAILSSHEDKPIYEKFCFAAEVGLNGEIRPVNQIEKRIQEAEKMGFKAIFLSKYNPLKERSTQEGIKIIPVSKIPDLHRLLFNT